MDHQGEILSADDKEIVVSLSVDADQCAGCAIAPFCSRPPEVKLPPMAGARPGRKVLLSAAGPLRRQAIWMLAAVPLALLMTALIACSLMGLPQWACGLVPLGAVAIWYAIVGMTAGHKARFHIKRLM